MWGCMIVLKTCLQGNDSLSDMSHNCALAFDIPPKITVLPRSSSIKFFTVYIHVQLLQTLQKTVIPDSDNESTQPIDSF